MPESANARVNVVFVCLGNICRSPTAEGVFRAVVERHGLDRRIGIDSAGTGAYKARYHNTQERSELVKFDDYFLGIPDKAPDLVRLQYGQTDPTVIALFERGGPQQMRLRQIGDVNVVADAGAVGCVIVGAENGYGFALATGGFAGHLDQVRGLGGRLPQFAIKASSSHIEVA